MAGGRRGGRRGVLSSVSELPRDAWTVLGGDALSAIGTGLTLPFLLVYYHQVRGIDLAVAGLAVAGVAVAGFVGNPLGGWLSDRIGPRNALVAGLVTSAAGAAFVAMVTHTWHAFAASGVIGLGAAVVWPAQDALLALTVAPRQRSTVFSVRHATLNAGFGIGGLLAAVIVDISRPASFVLIYALDAVTYLAFVPLLLTLRVGTRRVAASDGGVMPSGGFMTVLRDRTFVRLWLLTAVVVTISYGQFHAALPAFATTDAGVRAGALGLAYAANTITIVVVQLLVLRLLTGRARTTGVALACLAWGATWAITVAAGAVSTVGAATLLFALALVVFALGETMLSPTLAAIVNDLAPEELRGRYNGVATLAWTTGFMVGPAVGGVVLDRGRGGELFAALSVVCIATAAWSLRLARHLPEAANVIGDDSDEDAEIGAGLTVAGEGVA